MGMIYQRVAVPLIAILASYSCGPHAVPTAAAPAGIAAAVARPTSVLGSTPSPVEVLGNPALEYLADTAGDHSGVADPMEVGDLQRIFQESEGGSIFIFGLPSDAWNYGTMKGAYSSLDQAIEAITNPSSPELRITGPPSILEFDRQGHLLASYSVFEDETKRNDLSEMPYDASVERANSIMEHRRKSKS
tara:strand:- start:175 stop:744 length:570 start_codon:yes stop_codon:yes gene_type:complete